MRQSPELTIIQDKMQPGALSASGFLGEDTRNLLDILTEDEKTVKSKGLTHREIAERMRYFTEKGIPGLGEEVVVDENYIVRIDDHRGIILCPFSDDFKTAKTNTLFTNKKLNKQVIWSGLNIHMIEAHGFYEGRGAFFRIEPDEIGEILGLI